MKKIIETLFTLFIGLSLFAQDNSSGYTPKGMILVPAGSFQMKNNGKLANVQVEAFWMSNEVTNAEYREFVGWAKKNPDGKLYQVKYSSTTVSDPARGTMRDTTIRKIIPIEVSTIIPEIIDASSLETIDKQYKNYFTDPKYDDYPVIGVSYKLAEYYCIWKTTIENEKLNQQGLRGIQAFELPMEAQWDYAAQNNFKNDSQTPTKKIQKVNKVGNNKIVLSHFDNNVSEWVRPMRNEGAIIRGGSWNSGSDINNRTVTNENHKEPFVGFRIVQADTRSRFLKK
jgi:formylglycine-generating enzyme required for sulfatase activity